MKENNIPSRELAEQRLCEDQIADVLADTSELGDLRRAFLELELAN